MIKKFEEFIKLYESINLRTRHWREAIRSFLRERAHTSEKYRKYSKYEPDKINLYCFVDLSGSVNQECVYNFLNEVIGCCIEYGYNTVSVYGFGEHLSDPYKLNIDDSLKDIDNVVLSKCWDFLSSQKIGGATENFINIAEEMHKIKEEKNAAHAFMIFGDGYWDDIHVSSKYLYRDSTCVLAYYSNDDDSRFEKCIDNLTYYCDIKNVITTHMKELL